MARKAFCSWVCPVGTLSRALEWIGKKTLWRRGRRLTMPRWLDLPLLSLKYLLLAFFVWIVLVQMPVAALDGFMHSPYNLAADAKMLLFFGDLSTVTASVLVGLVILSVLVKHFWCRYLCPYGALLGVASLLSPQRVVRDPSTCNDCRACTRACPVEIPVHQRASVWTAECTGCMSCVSACTVSDCLTTTPSRQARAQPVAGARERDRHLARRVARRAGHRPLGDLDPGLAAGEGLPNRPAPLALIATEQAAPAWAVARPSARDMAPPGCAIGLQCGPSDVKGGACMDRVKAMWRRAVLRRRCRSGRFPRWPRGRPRADRPRPVGVPLQPEGWRLDDAAGDGVALDRRSAGGARHHLVGHELPPTSRHGHPLTARGCGTRAARMGARCGWSRPPAPRASFRAVG